MFPGYPINSITNGVHAATWTAEPFQHLYDRHIPEWRHDNRYLRYAVNLSLDEIRQAHREANQKHRVWAARVEQPAPKRIALASGTQFVES
jgi:glycogen phosphorylase